MAVSLSVSCAGYDIKKNHPHIIDTARGYARIYEAKPIDNPKCGEPDHSFVYTNTNKPIKDMSGFVCLPMDEYQYNYRFYLEWYKQQNKCPQK